LQAAFWGLVSLFIVKLVVKQRGEAEHRPVGILDFSCGFATMLRFPAWKSSTNNPHFVESYSRFHAFS
jgi:hypothetical protein